MLLFILGILTFPGITPFLFSGIGPDTLNHSFRLTESKNLLPDFEDSYGVIFRDLDGDQYPDIYVVRFRNLNRLFRNQAGPYPFLDWTIQSGLGGNLMPRGQKNLELGAASADLNNDGYPDMAIAGWGESTHLFVQNKNFRFEDIIRRSGIATPLDGNGAFWSDVNNDGYLDLFITDEHYPNRLFLGNGQGKFTDVSQSWGISGNRVSQGAAFGDLDGDGWADLYVCNWFAEDELYRNTGRDRLERVQSGIKHLRTAFNSNGVTLGDIDHDGDLDILVTDRDGESALYRNDIQAGDSLWTLTDITGEVGLSLNYPAYGTVMADFNNDGKQDLWVSSIGPNRLYLQDQQNYFIKAFEGEYLADNPPRYYSTGAAVADLELDGDLDLFVSNKDTNSILYINPVNNDHFIEIKVTGFRSNRDAIGTKISLFRVGSTPDSSILCGYQEISGGGGYLSQNSLLAHFGLAEKGRFFAEIRFPSRVVRRLDNLEAGHFYTINEYNNLLQVYFLGSQFLNRITGSPHFWLNIFLYLVLISSIILYVWLATGRYQWKPRHVAAFFLGIIVVLLGIFTALQENPLHWQLLTEIIILAGLFLLLTFFMEKIRKLEIIRNTYRTLLQDFSRKLIFYKDNKELHQKLVSTISDLTRCKFCAFYEYRNGQLSLSAHQGEFSGPENISLNEEASQKLIADNENIASILVPFPDPLKGHHFPVSRDNHLYGLLTLGEPSSSYQFTNEDFDVFRTLTGQTAIAIENIHYIENTKKLIRQITEAKTREKYLSELENANRKLKKQNRKLQELYEDLKNTQTQLIQSEKMAGLGQLVAGVAHELNNPISYIYANMKTLDSYTLAISRLLALLKEPSMPEADLKGFVKSLQQIRSEFDLEYIQTDLQNLIRESIEGSDRVKQVVQNLRNFSRLDESDFKQVNIHEGIESTLLLLNNELKNRISVHRNFGEIPLIYCQPGNLNQVFMNILLNAIQAIEGSGNIWITTSPSEQAIRISIRDDGKGIPARYRDKIFDPFFTTKPVGKGTGLGLSICYKIIRDHQGKIEFSSQEGQGTEFVIELPVMNKTRSESRILDSPQKRK